MADSAPEEPDARELAQQQRLRVRAARLRVVLDRRLERPTPERVRRLADEPLARTGEARSR